MGEALTAEDGAALTRLAADAVRRRLLDEPPPGPPDGPAALLAPGASFVTLERKGRLRGCIGTLLARRPLHQDVARNAERAMADPRLPPVDTGDWPELDVSVSVLSAPEPLAVTGRDELLAVLRPGVDGLLLAGGDRRATFLPVVWEKLADPRRFLDHLLAKGGWAPGGWPRDVTASRYTAVEFTDPAPREPLDRRDRADGKGPTCTR
jgi:AmmeMemoRadiSam system protein A